MRPETTPPPEMIDLDNADALRPMIAPARTALIVIDVQNDFVSPEGALGQAGLDMRLLEPALAEIEMLIAGARGAQIPIVFARVVTRPETDSEALRLKTARSGLSLDEIAICRAGTPGVDYYRVQPHAGDIEIEKTLYSCFVNTSLDETLRERGIDTLVVCGFTTECCVDSTIRDAFHRNYNVFLAADACAAYSPALHASTLQIMAESFALLVETAAVTESWSA